MQSHVCMHGGRAENVYLKKDSGRPEPEAIPLNPREGRADEAPVRQKWREIAASGK